VSFSASPVFVDEGHSGVRCEKASSHDQEDPEVFSGGPKLTVCYELAADFVELYRAHGHAKGGKQKTKIKMIYGPRRRA
jgi:hypothetical protein